MIKQTLPIADKLLSDGLKLTNALYDQLVEEQSILLASSSQDPALLANTIQNKQQLIKEIGVFSQQMGQILQTEKLSNDRKGIEAYFQKASEAGIDISITLEKWQGLSEIAQKCQILNEQNGASIDLLLRHTNQSLNILKGKPETSSTYGPDGTKKMDLFSGTVISV